MTSSPTNLNDPQPSGFADPAGEAPWALQLIIHIEKSAPPTRTDAVTASALATLQLLSASESNPGWSQAVTRWTAGRIRKHARRARGIKWEAVQSLEGVTASFGTAEVRALVPTPVDTIPQLASKLQLSGPELADPQVSEFPEGVSSRPHLAVYITPSPPLSLGKAAAAAAHAAQVAWMTADVDLRDSWRRAGFSLSVHHPSPSRFAALSTLCPVNITDAGFTEVDPLTVTSRAAWL